MKKIYYLAVGLMFIVILCFVVISCSKDKDTERVDEKIDVDQSELTFTQKGESKDFNVFCTNEWHFEATGLEGYYGPNMADVKDFTIEPASGTGNTKVTVTLKNDLTESYDVPLKIVTENNHIILKLKAVASVED
jgi:hypothetical protein